MYSNKFGNSEEKMKLYRVMTNKEYLRPDLPEAYFDFEKSFIVVEKLKNSNDMLNLVFSYLSGSDIIHRIAVVSRRFRSVAHKLGTHTEFRVVTLLMKQQ